MSRTRPICSDVASASQTIIVGSIDEASDKLPAEYAGARQFDSAHRQNTIPSQLSIAKSATDTLNAYGCMNQYNSPSMRISPTKF